MLTDGSAVERRNVPTERRSKLEIQRSLARLRRVGSRKRHGRGRTVPDAFAAAVEFSWLAVTPIFVKTNRVLVFVGINLERRTRRVLLRLPDVRGFVYRRDDGVARLFDGDDSSATAFALSPHDNRRQDSPGDEENDDGLDRLPITTSGTVAHFFEYDSGSLVPSPYSSVSDGNNVTLYYIIKIFNIIEIIVRPTDRGTGRRRWSRRVRRQTHRERSSAQSKEPGSSSTRLRTFRRSRRSPSGSS